MKGNQYGYNSTARAKKYYAHQCNNIISQIKVHFHVLPLITCYFMNSSTD